MHAYFVGFDVHKQVIAYCVKTPAGEIVMEGKIGARRAELDELARVLPTPWHGGMEATMFSHWIYRHLKPHAAGLEMGHAARMKAISAGKKKSDKVDARTIADLLRANLFPSCYVIAPELEGLRRQMRYRRLVVHERVLFQNSVAGMLMSAGVEYEKKRLHGKRYFEEVTKTSPWIGEEMRALLRFNREQIETLHTMDKRLIRMLERQPQLEARVKALTQIDGVGPVMALTWALEIGDPNRFPSIKKAVSYCGLSSALRESAGRQQRGPLSKQRNAHLQTMLIEVAKLAPRNNAQLKEVHDRETKRGGHRNRATLAVARKLVGYLLAADRALLANDQTLTQTASH